DLSRRKEAPGAQHAAALDHTAVHDRRAHSDERLVFQTAAVNETHMPDEHVITDERLEALGGHVHDGPVLQIGAGTHADHVHVATYDAVEPDARPLADPDVANDMRARGNERGLVNGRRNAAIRRYVAWCW